MKEYRDASNRLSIDLANIDYDTLFQKFANLLQTEFKGKLIEKIEGLDGRYWDFDINGTIVVLHSNAMAGISIYAEDGSNETLIREIGKKLLES